MKCVTFIDMIRTCKDKNLSLDSMGTMGTVGKGSKRQGIFSVCGKMVSFTGLIGTSGGMVYL